MKKILFTAIAFALIITMIYPLNQAVANKGGKFSDVSSEHWAKEEIDFLSSKGIITGFSDGSFKPGNSITRTQAAIMLVRALDLDTKGRPDPGFNDIDKSFREYDVIATVADEGILTGRNGNFMPNANLTRGQMAAILYRAYNLEGNNHIEFKDVSKDFGFYKEIQALAANGITTGFSDNTFRPGQPTTRAHFSVFLARILDDRFKSIEEEHFQIIDIK